MSQDCRNSVTAFGPAVDIQRMKDALESNTQVVSFESILPSPEELIESTKAQIITPALVEKYGSMDIGSWRLANWGCVVDAYDSEIVKEDTLDLPGLDANTGFIDKLSAIDADKAEEIKKTLFPMDRVIQYKFRTQETPTGAISELSKQFPSVIIHFGYDSDSEDVCGWANLKGGEITNHEHYDSSLRSIRLHVEPFSEDSGSLLEGLIGGNEDNTSN